MCLVGGPILQHSRYSRSRYSSGEMQSQNELDRRERGGNNLRVAWYKRSMVGTPLSTQRLLVQRPEHAVAIHRLDATVVYKGASQRRADAGLRLHASPQWCVVNVVIVE